MHGWKITPIGNTWLKHIPTSNVHGANMGPIWVLSAPGGSHVGPINLAMRDINHIINFATPLVDHIFWILAIEDAVRAKGWYCIWHSLYAMKYIQYRLMCNKKDRVSYQCHHGKWKLNHIHTQIMLNGKYINMHVLFSFLWKDPTASIPSRFTSRSPECHKAHGVWCLSHRSYRPMLHSTSRSMMAPCSIVDSWRIYYRKNNKYHQTKIHSSKISIVINAFRRNLLT